MEIPKILESAIEKEIQKSKISELKEEAKSLSYRYMNQKRTGESFITNEQQAIVYSIIRMPATYAAVATALKHILELTEKEEKIKIETVLDVGAGTGAGSWAVRDLINFKQITCIEKDVNMRKVGMKLMNNDKILKETKWINIDIVKEKEDITGHADLVIASYMTNELKKEDRIKAIEKLIRATNEILLIIEPGTPEGHQIIKEIKKYCIKQSLYVLAPCVTQEECKLPSNDWCHSTCRIQRTKIHKILKDGDAPYEDEKFSYIAVSKEKVNLEKNMSRILRHPIIKSGFINMRLCTRDGIKNTTISKRDGELYKQAKKKHCGDTFKTMDVIS